KKREVLMAQVSSRDVKPRGSLKIFFLLLLWIIIPGAWCGLLCVSASAFFSTLTWRPPNGNQAAQLSVGTSFPTYRYIFLFLIVLLIVSAAIVVGRWALGNKERMQTVLLIFSYVFCGLSILFSIVLFSLRTYPWFFVALIVVAVAFAFARTKLFEASAFINRTLVYSILTISLALIYFGVIAALQLLDPKNVTKSEPDIVISTLIAVVMFYPLRIRIQKIIDK